MASSPSAATERPGLIERLTEDMASRWRQGERPLAEEYLAHHPELWDDPETALELISEEIAQREEHCEEISAADLTQRFPRWQRQVQALLGCHRLLAPHLASPRFPEAGDSLGDFRLRAELGRGMQGRVFLATQPALADRAVVLKLIPVSGEEHLALARLQHTHIVPLYSVHDFPARRLQALCLPYFGGATLSALLEALRDLPPPRRSGRALLDALRQTSHAVPSLASVDGPTSRLLARASYVQALCWIGACLADALQFAHERGLVHLDLKPSNVLLAADGLPMLLDFHLARPPLAAGAPAPAWLGGTPGYMAPEHEAALAAVRAAQPLTTPVDGRADVYALGLLLYEALAGAPAAAMPARSLRRANPQVSPGLAALLARCLAVDPRDRYPSAGALAADLRRHLADQPLRGVANRSAAERWLKWRRRRPHALPLLVLLLGCVLAGAALAAYLLRQTQHAQLALREGQERLHQRRYVEADASFRHGRTLGAHLPWNSALLRGMDEGLHRAQRGRAAGELHQLCERLRPLYGVPLLPGQGDTIEANCLRFWQQRAAIVERLGAEAVELQEQVQADLLDLAIVWADLHVRRSPDRARRARREALAVLAEAETLFGPSAVLCQERAAHARALGETVLAEEIARRGACLKPRTAWEHYALGRAAFRAGDLVRAEERMEQALEKDPQALWPSYYKGCCAYRRGQHDDAVIAFSACVVLAPRCAWCYHNRALAELARGRRDQARRDLDRALHLEPTLTTALFNRGMLHVQEKHLSAAVADFRRMLALSLESGAPAPHE